MISHFFTCGNCGCTIRDTDTIDIHVCPICDEDMRWDLNIAIRGNYTHPIHSDALAIHPNQRAEHERLFPNIRLDEQNRPIFDNFVNHENYLKKCGLVKLPQKIKVKKEILKSNC